MARYALDIKPSARKELENLSDSLIARLQTLRPELARRLAGKGERGQGG